MTNPTSNVQTLATLLERLRSPGGRYMVSVGLSREERDAQPEPTYGGKGHMRWLTDEHMRWLTDEEYVALCALLSGDSSAPDTGRRTADVPREGLLGKTLRERAHQLRVAACSAWSDVVQQPIPGLDAAKCQYAKAIEDRLRAVIDELADLSSAQPICNCRSLPEPPQDTCPVHGLTDETSDGWQKLHRAVAAWSAIWSRDPSADFTALNKILAAHNPFTEETKPTNPDACIGKWHVPAAITCKLCGKTLEQCPECRTIAGHHIGCSALETKSSGLCADPNCQTAHPHQHPTPEEKYFAPKASTDVILSGFELLYSCPSCQTPMKCGAKGWEYQCDCHQATQLVNQATEQSAQTQPGEPQ